MAMFTRCQVSEENKLHISCEITVDVMASFTVDAWDT